jgi:hypothetical protein
MADYMVYGFAAYEIEVRSHIKQKVFFAISMAHRPLWLSWYLYSQDMAEPWREDYMHHRAEWVAVIGDMLNIGTGTLFSHKPQINVNSFAGKTHTTAILTTADRGATLDYRIQLLGPAVLLNFKLARGVPSRSFSLPKHGVVYKLGSVDLSRTAVTAALKNGIPRPSLVGDDPLSTKL